MGFWRPSLSMTMKSELFEGSLITLLFVYNYEV